MLIIKISEPISSIKLYDISGKLVLTEKTKQEIQVSNFVKGIYIVSIITESGNNISKKIVIY